MFALKKFSFALTFCCSGFLLCAAEPDWTRSMETARVALAADDWAKALDALQSAAKAAESFPARDPRTPRTFNNLGMAQVHSGRLADAEQSLLRAWKLAEDADGPKSISVFVTLCNLADCNAMQKKYGTAGDLFGRALSFAEALRPPNPVAYANLARSLGSVYEAQGRYEQALEYFDSGRRKLFKAYNRSFHPDIPQGYMDSARIHIKMNNREKAETAYFYADQAIQDMHGKDDLRRVPILARQGEVSSADALASYAKEVLRILGKQTDALDASLFPALSSLAASTAKLAKGVKDVDQANELLQKAWALHQSAPTLNSTDSALARLQLAEVYRATMPDRADALNTQVKAWVTQNADALDKSTDPYAAVLLAKLGSSALPPEPKAPPTPPVTNTTPDTVSAVAPPPRPATGAVNWEHEWSRAYYRAVFASVLKDRMECWTEAVQVARELPEKDPRRLEALEGLAYADHDAQALEGATEWVQASGRFLGATHLDTFRARARVAELGTKDSNLKESEASVHAVLTDAEKAGIPAVQLAQFRFLLAQILVRGQSFSDAEKLLKQGLDDTLTSPGNAGMNPDDVLGALDTAVRKLNLNPNPDALLARYKKWEKAEKDARLWQSDFRKCMAYFSTRADCGVERFADAARLAVDAFGPQDSRTLKALHTAARAALAVQDFARAEKFLAALKDGLQHLPPAAQREQIGWAAVLLMQSDINLASGDAEAVEMELTVAMAKLEAEGSANTPTAATVLARLVRATRYQKKNAEALAQKSLALAEKIYGPASAQVRDEAIECFEQFLQNGKLTEAAELEKRIAVLPGPQATSAGAARKFRLLLALGDAQVKQHAYKDAALIFQDALTLIDASKGPASAEHGDVMLGLARCHRGLNQPAGAEKSLKESLDIQDRIWGSENPRTIAVYEEMLSFYKDQKKSIDAARIEQTLKYIKAFKPGIERQMGGG